MSLWSAVSFLFVLTSLVFAIPVYAEIRVSDQDRHSIHLSADFGIVNVLDDNTLIGVYRSTDETGAADTGVYAKPQDQPEIQIAWSTSENFISPGVVHSAGDFIAAQSVYRYVRARVSRPLQTELLEAPPGYHVSDDAHVQGITKDGCIYGYVFKGDSGNESVGAVWCENLETLVFDDATAITNLDPDTDLMSVRVWDVNRQEYDWFVQPLHGGTRHKLSFGASGEYLEQVASTAFNADRPRAFTAVVMAGSTVKIRIWNNDREPDPEQWAGETIEADELTGVDRVVALTERFVIYEKDDQCWAYSVDGIAQTLTGSNEVPARTCFGARENGNTLEVTQWWDNDAARTSYPIIGEGDITDLSGEELAAMTAFLSRCNSRRLERRALFEQAERDNGKRWRDIVFPPHNRSCRKRASLRFKVRRGEVARHHREMMYAGVGGDDLAWESSVPSAMRAAVSELESCVGTFASTDRNLIWSCARDIGSSSERQMGALDAYTLFQWVSQKGYPTSY